MRMSKIDHDRPALRRQGKALEAATGDAPAASTPFAAIARSRQREARQKAELSAIAADFLARRDFKK